MMPKQSLVERARSQPLYFWIVLLLGAAMLGQCLFTGVMIWRYSTDTRDWGWNWVRRGRPWIVGWVDSQGPAAGKLHAGDEILAILALRGHPRQCAAGLLAGRAIKEPSKTFVFLVISTTQGRA